MIIDQLFTRPIFEAADPSRLIATITLAKEYNADEPTKEIDLTGRFQGDVKSQMNQAADYLTQFLQSKGFNFTSIQLKYQGMVMNAQNRGAMAPQSDWEKEAEATANQMRAKRSVQHTAPALKEFAPSDDDSNGSDSEEMLRRMASHWWNGNERQMAKVENTLAAMGWEIGQDDGYDDGGVFVVRAGDEHGRSYISWPHEDLELNEGHLNEFARGEGGGDSGNYFKALASAWYNGVYDSGSLQKGIKTKEDIERLLDRGIVAPDGVTRKYNIDYNSDFDGVIIFSDDYYEHGDDDETDSRTGQPFGPYDYMEFSDDDLSESAMAEGRKKKKTSRSLGRYFFPGFGYYGSGDAGEGGGDGGGGESAKPGMAEATEDEYQDDYADEETELCNGCYVRDKEDSSGEIFVMRGDPGDRRVRIEDRHGRGWNIAPYRLTVVDDSDPDIAAYFGDELDEAGVTEAAQGHTIEAHGVRGMDRRTWHKTFRNTDQMIAWAEKHDAEIIGTRDLEQARHHNLSPAKAKGVTEGSEQKPAITYKDYTLQYDYQTEDDDPEGYSTATTYYFDVLKDGDRVGEAEYFDYFGNLTIRINGKTKEFGFRHPLASQISQLVSSLPDEQKKDLSDPRFESQGLTEVFADQGSGSTDRDNADYMKRRRAAKKAGYTGRETKAGTWRVFKDGNAVAAAGPFKSADEAAAWIKKHKQGITEMDKSEPSAGRDTGPREGPEKIAKPISKEKMTKDALDALSKSMAKKDDKKKDVKESDPLMLKLKRALIKEGRVKELADDLKTMPDSDFMKKYGKAKAAIRKDMRRIDEKLTTSDTLSRPAAKASSGKAIDDPDIMGSLKSASTPKFDRFSKTDSEPKIDFRAGLVGGEPEVEAEPRLMVDPLPDMQKWGGKFATGSAGGDNRFTAPAGWRYVEKDEDPARYGSAPAAAAAGSGLPNLIYDPQSRTLKSAGAPALDMSPKSKFKFDRAAQGQVPVDGSGANPNIDNATRDRARAYAAQQNAPADAAKKVDWKTIYALNKATIGSNPNIIKPRMQLNMPNGTIYLVQPGDTLTKIAAKQNQVNELSTEKLAQYKTAAARDARQADQEGDVKRGDKRFGGIVKATKKQFDNDAKKVDESRAVRRALMARIVNSG